MRESTEACIVLSFAAFSRRTVLYRSAIRSINLNHSISSGLTGTSEAETGKAETGGTRLIGLAAV